LVALFKKSFNYKVLPIAFCDYTFIFPLEATGRNTSANGNNQSANQAVLPGMQTQKKRATGE